MVDTDDPRDTTDIYNKMRLYETKTRLCIGNTISIHQCSSKPIKQFNSKVIHIYLPIVVYKTRVIHRRNSLGSGEIHQGEQPNQQRQHCSHSAKTEMFIRLSGILTE